MKAVELRTARCQQPATPATIAPPAIASMP
jgi:hypothetical protein